MTVRALLVVIDDERPLGPQLAGARLWGISWKLLSELSGGFTPRHLQNLAASSLLCERQAVQWGVTVTPLDKGNERGEVDAMSGVAQMLFGGGVGAASPVIIQQPAPPAAPSAPTSDSAEAEEAARKERAIAQRGVGRGNTILTDFALASQSPDVLKKTLGGA